MKINVVICAPLAAALVATSVGTSSLRAQTAPGITQQPATQTALLGASVVLTVGATGTPPLSYLWQFNGSNLIESLTIVAGGGATEGDGGLATNAQVELPRQIAFDSAGNLYIAEWGDPFQNYPPCVRKVDTSGVISTVAGNGSIGFSGDGGYATNASLYGVGGVVVDGQGRIFLCDGDNHRVRVVSTNGIITTFAGNGIYGASGDGGPATNAELSRPVSLAFDDAGNLLIADDDGGLIRKVTADGNIQTVAGTGAGLPDGDGGAATNANLGNPCGVAADSSGNIYIANLVTVRKVDTNGIITTVSTNQSQALTVDAAGNLYIANFESNQVYELMTNGVLAPLGGEGNDPSLTSGFLGGIALSPSGKIFVSDMWDAIVWSFAPSGPSLPVPILWRNAGNYDVVVSNAYGSVTSAVAQLTIAGLPPKVTITQSEPTYNMVNIQFITQPNMVFILSVAADMTPPVTWSGAAIQQSDSNGVWSTTITNLLIYPQAFYRLDP
jgi:hypothetical protein